MKNKKLLIVVGIVGAWFLLVAYMVMSNRSSQPSTAGTNTSMDTSKLIIEDEVIGKGDEAKAGTKVTVHYVGTLTDGTEFDASRKHGNQGFTFALGAGQVIKGWDVGVLGMKVGGKRKLTIPSEMAYGNQAVGSIIPANATLIFEVELLKVTK
jgi:peptidylprolyl isomerase/FKBP-type peptidyl-prolyl cis-trans isomerase FkpA